MLSVGHLCKTERKIMEDMDGATLIYVNPSFLGKLLC